MSTNLARLRKRAAELEQKKQFDRALEVYVQILDEGGKDLDDEDVPLFNRVGDMLMRQGSVTEALGYYERAVDMYAERGYLNNAIALCSKILRQSPGRAAVYYKLARISARKGFKSDARKNFLEYADRMQKLGMADEAFRALKEFASLYPDQDDVRLILAELLSKENRKGEAIEQLQSLYEKLQAEGRAAEARATVDRMRAIDPSVTPKEGSAQPTPAAAGDLVFLDLNDAEAADAGQRTVSQPPSARAPVASPVPALDGLSITFFPDEPEAETPHPEGFESTAMEPEPRESPSKSADTPAASQLVVEPDYPATSRDGESIEDIELRVAPDPRMLTPVNLRPVTPLDMLTQGPPLERVEHIVEDLVPERPPRPPSRTPPPLSSFEFADIELDDTTHEHRPRTHDLNLPGKLPAAETEEVDADTPVPSLESVAAAEDARAAAEEAADLAADVAAREAEQQPIPAGWQSPTPPMLPNDAEVEEDFPAIADSVLEGRLDAGPTGEVPDDFLSMPPSFGARQEEDVDDHAFPPLPGLDETDAVARAPEAEPDPVPAPAPVAASGTPRATISIGSAESHLRSRLELDPENWELRRQLGEALLDTGDRDGGLYELELAMTGFDLRGQADRAQEVVDVILKVSPASIPHHQKRVEYAVRSRDRSRLAYAYLELADALFRSGSAEKAVAVYGRVLELDPANERAEFALATLSPSDLARLRGRQQRPERWTDELATISGQPAAGEPSPADALPDERANGNTGTAETPAEESATSSASNRIRFRSIELPVPDWGEGVPTPAPAVRPEFSPSDADQAVDDALDAPAPDEDESPVADVEPGSEEPVMPTPDHRQPSGPSPRIPTPLAAPVAHSLTPERAPEIRATTPLAVPAPRAPTPGPLPAHHAPVPAVVPLSPAVPAYAVPDGDEALQAGDSEYIDLGEWLRNTEPVRSTRMQVEDPKPTGDEQADFEEMLRRFKRGVAENVEAEDYEAHYDLGVAYKEMGLVDEAIAQFQKALRDPDQRVRSYEALGQCFVEKEQYPIAAALLQRATEVPGSDDQVLVGVLYLLGFATEQLGRPADALPYYLRVFAVDIEFRDVAERVAALGKLTK
jgi:tetratricopeptide (TPR) repeat protein